MLIQLKQTEIEAALKMYIVSQGINLNNRTVDISFTSGRKDNGISADLDILDGDAVNCNPVYATPVEAKTSGEIPERTAVPQAAFVPQAVAAAEPETIEEDTPFVEQDTSKISLFG